MAEACLHRDEVIGERHQRKSPREQDGARNPLLERQAEAEKGRQTDEEVIHLTNRLDKDTLFSGLRQADPEEVETLQAVLDETEFVGADILLGEFAFATDISGLAHLAVLLEDGTDVADRNRRSPWEALMFFKDGLMELRAQVAAHRNESVEDGVVADDPRSEAGDDDRTGECPAKKCR